MSIIIKLQNKETLFFQMLHSSSEMELNKEEILYYSILPTQFVQNTGDT